MSFSVTAFITCYNEADILPWTIKHLQEQGVSVYLIDNWSTDGTYDCMAWRSDLVGYQHFPASGPSRYYSWRLLLGEVEAVAQRSKSDWCIHHDADEIRRSPRLGETLLEAFQRVDREGYSAVNHDVFHFMPTDDDYRGDPERHFRYYLKDHDGTAPQQIKAWKNTGQRVDLSSSGGHVARFPGMKVYPEKFILKHYPMRTAAQAERKVIHERMERYDPYERQALRWHVQYDGLVKTRDWIKDPKVLTEWKEPVLA